MNKEIADIRKDYLQKSLLEADTAANPIAQFTTWWNEAVASNIDEVNALTLSTINAAGYPNARIVLLKSYDEQGFVFFTNYTSAKGAELAQNAKASMVFFWKELERQVRILGSIEKLSDAESDAYFNSRPAGSRIGAWSSPQSQIIANRDILEANMAFYAAKFGDAIPRPPHWGGYSLKPISVEFWQGRSSRLHDRIKYELNDTQWQKVRLAP